LPSGRIVYKPLEEVSTVKKKNVLYARVSDTKQKDDLERQKQILRQFMTANGVIVDEEYSDIASGMNESRAGFSKMLKECIEGKIDTIFITYKDRLTRVLVLVT
jgi:predicted site-specific integrase-resolvase